MRGVRYGTLSHNNSSAVFYCIEVYEWLATLSPRRVLHENLSSGVICLTGSFARAAMYGEQQYSSARLYIDCSR